MSRQSATMAIASSPASAPACRPGTASLQPRSLRHKASTQALWLLNNSLAKLPAHRLFPVVRESTERVPSGEVATSSTCLVHSAMGPSAAAFAQQELQPHLWLVL